MAHTTRISPPFPQILDYRHQNSWLCFFLYFLAPSNNIFDIFFKIFENLGFEYLRGPGAFGENYENFVFFNWRKFWFFTLNVNSVGLAFLGYTMLSLLKISIFFLIFVLKSIIFDLYDSRIHFSQILLQKWPFLVFI